MSSGKDFADAQKPLAAERSSDEANKHVTGLAGFSASYTVSYLQRSRSNEGVDKLIRKVTMVADQAIDRVHAVHEEKVRNEGAPPLACKKGCSHCCHQYVGCSVPEVLYAANYVRTTYSQEDLEALKQRLRDYKAAHAAIPAVDRPKVIKSTCPLLVDDCCSIFEVRPLACRGFNSLDVDACKRARVRSDVAVLSLNHQASVTHALSWGITKGLQESNVSDILVEFIEALLIALDNEDATERYFAGDPLFEAVKLVR